MLEKESKNRFRDLSLQEIDELVRSLNSLSEGELGISMLVACGERAVPALRECLLYGRPSGVFVPRQRAVRALAELGAKEILLEYLAAERSIRDPVVAHGEEAVKNTAARALAAWRTDEVFQALLDVLRKHQFTGVIEAIGKFRRVEALPELVHALEDDFCRTFAEDALLKIGPAARAALIEAVRTPDPSGNNETASSRQRRASALRLIERLEPTPDDWPRLAALLYDPDAKVAARTGILALKIAAESEKVLAVRRLIGALEKADWFLQSEIENSLEEHFAIARPLIRQEIGRRQTNTFGTRNTDNVLRLLRGIVDRNAQRKAM